MEETIVFKADNWRNPDCSDGGFCCRNDAGKERWQMTAMVLLVFAGLFDSLYVGIESLLVLNRDLRTKESHMLFMVPYSAWSILGAKVLAAFLQIVLTSVLFAVSFFLCFTAYVGASQGFAQFFPMLQRLLREWFDFQLDWKWIVLDSL